jgi:GAF domain-containing protein
VTQTREREIVRSFIGLTDTLVQSFDVLDLTIRLTEDCARLLDVAAAGVLLADARGELHLLAATSEQARILELYQLQGEEGPCLDCYHGRRAVSVPDLRASADRWPRFAAAAAEVGFASVHAIPINLRDEMVGALGLFGTTAGSLSADDLNLAQALAHVASIAILQQNPLITNATVAPGVQTAVASRRVLEMAKGVLSEQLDIPMDEAFTRLRRLAGARGEQLGTLARSVVSAEPGERRALLSEIPSASGADGAALAEPPDGGVSQ